MTALSRAVAPDNHRSQMSASSSPRCHSASDSSSVCPPASSRRTTSFSSARAASYPISGRSASDLAPLRASSAAPRSSMLTGPTLWVLSDRAELATGDPNPQGPERFGWVPHHPAAGCPNDRIAAVERGLRRQRTDSGLDVFQVGDRGGEPAAYVLADPIPLGRGVR